MKGITEKEVKDKLEAELAEAKKCGKYAAAVMKSCVDALTVFAKQDEEFAEAILDGSLVECAKTIESKCKGKSSISDLEVYKIAVGHYFRGADVEFEMLIKVNPYEANTPPAEDKITVNKKISLFDLI
jgi:hypothetical protein